MDQWIYINENFIRITDLPYGNYTLKIKGRNSSNHWSDQELSLNIKALKPFYVQWWFFMVVGIVLVGSTSIIIKRRINELEKNKRQLEQEVLKRTEKIQKQAKALKALDIEKTRFFSNITHEFRTPLTLIIGPIEQIIENQPSQNIFKRRMNGILRNAEHLLELINQMLDISKIESNRMKVDLIYGDIIDYTRGLVKHFEPLTKKKAQHLIFVANQDNWKIHFDKEKWNKIIYNLLSNALKFTSKGETIQISLLKIRYQGKDVIRLDVKDTGLGIEKEELNHIFDRFYQIDNTLTRTQGGTGIGLALVKELVELQKGEIWASSEVNKGTSFIIHLPILENEPPYLITEERKPEFSFSPIAIDEKSQDIQQSNPSGSNKKLELLIIEDNDEMREYIRYCVDPEKYNITEARNGEEGIQQANLIVPDLIISDLMMPKKTGFQVVEEIRNHLITSHIPIILLTARASLESRLEGLSRGADAYLTKPFSAKELILRIQKLIEIRQFLQQRYQNSTEISEEKTFQKEDAFILELRNFILDNIDNTKLNGDIIGQNFGLSRSHLHRKMKALTNQSISEFVKGVRLQKALELIQAGNLNVSEITYQTGFSSISYFSRTFKKAYGKAPSEM